MRQRQVALHYVGHRQSGARVAFAHASVARQVLGLHHGAAQVAVADVVVRAGAEYRRRVGAADADVVEHGRLVDELRVDVELGGAGYDFGGIVGHGAAVSDQNLPLRRAGGVVFVDDV